MMHCMMQWIKGLSLEIRLNMFSSSQNNENRQQNKLINMVNDNDLIKHHYWPYLYLTCSIKTNILHYFNISDTIYDNVLI